MNKAEKSQTPFPESTRLLIPLDMEGSLFASEMNEDTLQLYDEITASGHSIGISETNFEDKSPFYVSGRLEVIGKGAIRSYFGLGVSSSQ